MPGRFVCHSERSEESLILSSRGAEQQSELFCSLSMTEGKHADAIAEYWQRWLQFLSLLGSTLAEKLCDVEVYKIGVMKNN